MNTTTAHTLNITRLLHSLKSSREEEGTQATRGKTGALQPIIIMPNANKIAAGYFERTQCTIGLPSECSENGELLEDALCIRTLAFRAKPTCRCVDPHSMFDHKHS